MTEFPQLEKSVPETDIEKIKENIQRFKELPGGSDVPHQDLVKRSIQAIAPVPAQPISEPADAPQDVTDQVQNLLSVAMNKGIYEANDIAQKSHPYVMDQFHDVLTGQLYPELKKRGIVE